MSYKHILVHLDSSPHVEARIDAAAALAVRHGAFLRGLFAQADRSTTSVIARRSSEHLAEASSRSRELFQQKLQAAGLQGQWHGLEHGEYNHVIRELIIWSRFADLTVVSQYDREAGSAAAPEELNEQLVLNAGRPVLVLPYAGTFPVIGKRVAVAWNAEREAARALSDAMPILQEASEVTVVTVLTQNTPHTETHRVGILDHLSLHGVKAEQTHFTVTDIGAMDALLARAMDSGADLMVMGAHGHYGFPFLHRGGGTRHMLRTCPVPLLLSH
ncbi:universal stress protein [Azospirillum thermophilum]|uniref:Universal stress protein UspA n=1 Tax=Azospirillum thermophilum TaxID=2202148 RepID=A0A2S2CR03_9PROT|nr:universal stress protein [Azospirillum thermophilum]AWK86916.1 universal stress protein UspA [Azospirillum thermophilum]